MASKKRKADAPAAAAAASDEKKADQAGNDWRKDSKICLHFWLRRGGILDDPRLHERWQLLHDVTRAHDMQRVLLDTWGAASKSLSAPDVRAQFEYGGMGFSMGAIEEDGCYGAKDVVVWVRDVDEVPSLSMAQLCDLRDAFCTAVGELYLLYGQCLGAVQLR